MSMYGMSIMNNRVANLIANGMAEDQKSVKLRIRSFLLQRWIYAI